MQGIGVLKNGGKAAYAILSHKGRGEDSYGRFGSNRFSSPVQQSA